MSAVLLRWWEIATDDYHPRVFPDSVGGAAWIDSSDRVHAPLQEQLRGEHRLRLVLREAVDLKRGPKANPLWYWDYDIGPPAIICVAEMRVQTKKGQRRQVGENGLHAETTKPATGIPGRASG